MSLVDQSFKTALTKAAKVAGKDAGKVLEAAEKSFTEEKNLRQKAQNEIMS